MGTSPVDPSPAGTDDSTQRAGARDRRGDEEAGRHGQIGCAADAATGDGTGRIDVTVDVAAVPGLALTGQKPGSLPFGELRLGDTATAATFDIVLDDIVVSADGS